MMLVISFFAAGLFAASALALPAATPLALDKCQTTIGPNAFGNLGPFTLAAVNKTVDVLTHAGVPLHLSPSVSVSGAGNAARSLATNETFPRDEFPEFRLVAGGLVSAKNASTGLSAAATDVNAGSPLTFTVSSEKLVPDPIFCAVVGTSPAGGNPIYPLLALHGDSQSFSLCKGHSVADHTALDVVVYQPSANRSDEYALDSCYEVYVQLVPTAPY